MDDVTAEKKALRARMKKLRESLGADERSRIDSLVARNVIDLAAYREAGAVFTYLSVGAEVDTREIIEDAWRASKLVAVPRCVPGTRLMTWHRIESFAGVESSAFGIEEPPYSPDTLIEPGSLPSGMRAVALVPAYSFDARGYRLGYGGGFYDAFLPAFPGVSAGLCRMAQLSDAPLPLREGDVAVDFVVTECGIRQHSSSKTAFALINK